MTPSSPPVTVGSLLRARADRLSLGLEILAGADGLGRGIASPYVLKTGLALAGFDTYLQEGRVLVFGASEVGYLNGQDPSVRAAKTLLDRGVLGAPVFATIDLRSDAAGQLHVADIDLGNGNMGLVLSAYHGFTTERFVGTTSVSYDGVEFYGDTGELRGEIKGSRIGFNVTTSDGTILTTNFGGVDLPGVYAEIDTISWRLPFLPDTDLSGLN